MNGVKKGCDNRAVRLCQRFTSLLVARHPRDGKRVSATCIIFVSLFRDVVCSLYGNSSNNALKIVGCLTSLAAGVFSEKSIMEFCGLLDVLVDELNRISTTTETLKHQRYLHRLSLYLDELEIKYPPLCRRVSSETELHHHDLRLKVDDLDALITAFVTIKDVRLQIPEEGAPVFIVKADMKASDFPVEEADVRRVIGDADIRFEEPCTLKYEESSPMQGGCWQRMKTCY